MAGERHLRDLENGTARGLTFDTERANRAIRFFDNLKHFKGEWAGQPLTLEPWQCFIIGSLFGWVRADGHRRFRVAYTEVPRKNGKSTIAAGVALLLAFFDNEPAAEVACVATKRDQAKLVFDVCKRIVQTTPALKQRLQTYVGNISSTATGSKLEPLGADADTMDGLNIHGAIIDELHAHKTRAVVDVIETATAARRQSLQFEITTAGLDDESVCKEHHDYSARVLQQIVDDDTWFAFMAGIDEGDRWDDPAVWAKANPNFGISVKEDDLRRKCEKAKAIPAAQNAFRRLHLNEWTQQAERWFDLDAWDACKADIDIDKLRGLRCFAGLDLASVSDLCALVLAFMSDDEADEVFLLSFFWVPEETAEIRAHQDSVPYDVWGDEGFLDLTSGRTVDYEAIRVKLLELHEEFQIEEIAYDPWNATQLVTQLQADGLECFPTRQGFASLSAPSKALEALVVGRKLKHNGHPVLRWNVNNVAREDDAHGNIKPSKKKSKEKIDGVVAAVMALDRLTRHLAGENSYYDNNPLEVL